MASKKMGRWLDEQDEMLFYVTDSREINKINRYFLIKFVMLKFASSKKKKTT